jgi:hypothetical protein
MSQPSTTTVDYFSALVSYLEVPSVQLRPGGRAVLVERVVRQALSSYVHTRRISGPSL